MKKLFWGILFALPCCAMAGPDEPWSASVMYDAARELGAYSYQADLSDQQRERVSLALGWFTGATGALQASGVIGPERKLICFQEPRTSSDLAREYVAYVDAHREQRSHGALEVLIEALKQDHPCK